jgi:hypothetical protein
MAERGRHDGIACSLCACHFCRIGPLPRANAGVEAAAGVDGDVDVEKRAHFHAAACADASCHNCIAGVSAGYIGPVGHCDQVLRLDVYRAGGGSTGTSCCHSCQLGHATDDRL